MPEAAGIAYEAAGEGPPLICLHGVGGSAESFRPQLDELSGRRVIAWTMPGYAGAALAEMTFPALADALAEFMDALGLARAAIAGHSLGGMIAQEFAHRHPDRTGALVLIATTPAFGGRDETFKRDFLTARLAPLDEGRSMRDAAEGLVPTMLGPEAPAAAREAAIASMAAIPPAAYRASLDCLVTFDRRADLARLPPVLLIAGGEDRTAPRRAMEKMQAAAPDAELAVIETAGHLIPLEAPARTNALIEAYLDRKDPQ